MRTSARAQRVEPFYVMEMAKSAAAIAREAAGTDRPMIYLNIGEPDFTAPPLVQEAAARADQTAALTIERPAKRSPPEHSTTFIRASSLPPDRRGQPSSQPRRNPATRFRRQLWAGRRAVHRRQP